MTTYFLVFLSLFFLFVLVRKNLFLYFKNKKVNKKLKKIKANFASDIFLAKKAEVKLWLAEDKKVSSFSQVENYNQQIRQILKNNPVVNQLIAYLFHCKNLEEFCQRGLKVFLNIIHNARFTIYLKGNQPNEFALFFTLNNNEKLYQKNPLVTEITTAFKTKEKLSKGLPLMLSQIANENFLTTIYFPFFSTELKAIAVIDYQKKSDFLYKEEVLYKLLFLFKEMFLHFHQTTVTLIDNFFFTFEYYQKLNTIVENYVLEYMEKKHYSFFSIQIIPNSNLTSISARKFNENFILFLRNNFFKALPLVYLGEKPMTYTLLFFSWLSEKDVMSVIDKFFITPNLNDAKFFRFIIRKKNLEQLDLQKATTFL